MKRNGWEIRIYPSFQEKLDKLLANCKASYEKDPEKFKSISIAKLLFQVIDIVENIIPADPTHRDFFLGKTFGDSKKDKAYKDWRRVKFGNARFRMFFKFNSQEKVIIIAWMNDENNLRKIGSNSDAYEEFKRMLKTNHPPNNWLELKEQSLAMKINEIYKSFNEIRQNY
jgi:toxin YhaV